MVFQFFAVKRWQTEDLVWRNEMKSYYGYLPALHIYGDVALEKTELTPQLMDRFYYPQPGPKRGHIFKTTMGVAIMQTPFFLIAHSIAINFNDPVDGYSRPYRILTVISAMFYCFFGLLFVRSTLVRFFADWVVSLVLITLFMGTNLYFYTLYEGAMSHAYSFFLVAVFVYYTVSWHTRPTWWKMCVLGLAFGLIVLVRPVNGCVALFFLLYRDASQATLKEKFGLLFSQWKGLLSAAACVLLVLAPQLAYWKYTGGSFFFYSYGEESFFWLRPKIWLGLFSYQKGWLVWTPVMWFAILGLLGLRKAARPAFWAVLVTLPVYVYVIFCWWCWWYGGGFGMRPMIDVMPILALPLAAFFRSVGNTKFLVWPVLGIWFFLVSLNLFQTRQYAWGKLHWAGTTKPIYWQMFLNDYPQENLSHELREPNLEEAMKGETGL